MAAAIPVIDPDARPTEDILTLVQMRKGEVSWNAGHYHSHFEQRPDLRVSLVNSVCNNLNALPNTSIGTPASAWVDQHRDEIKGLIANPDPIQRALTLTQLALHDAVIDVPFPLDLLLPFFKLKCGTHLAAAKQLSAELDTLSTGDQAKRFLEKLDTFYKKVTSTPSACDRSCAAYLTAVLHLLYLPSFRQIPGLSESESHIPAL